MKKDTGSKIKLSMFITVGIVLLLGCIYFLGEKQRVFSQTFHISGMFKDVTGLQPGNNVRFSGINVGTVDDIEIVSDSTVRVDLLISEGTRKFIKKDATAIIGSDGPLGNRIIRISPGGAGTAEIADGDVIMTDTPVSIDDLLVKLKETADNASSITGDLSVIMAHIRNGDGTIGKLFMDTVFAKNIDQTVINLKQGAGGFKQNMDAAKHSFLLRRFLKGKKSDKDSSKSK